MLPLKILHLIILLFGVIGLSHTQSFNVEHHKIADHKHEVKTVFLTGAAGFIGSNFLKYMFDRYPHYRFLVLDVLTYAGNLENIPAYIRRSPRFEFFYGSVTNYHLVDLLMSRADFVVHFAAESHVTRSIVDDITFFETDVMGTRVMMTALVKHAKTVQRYIHISTSEVCGTAEYQPMDEDHPLNPRSPYAAAKAGADRLVYAYWCTYDIPALIFRPFNNYGPQQHLEKCIPRFIYNALRGQPLTVHGDGSQARDWVHTFDIARALDMALHHTDFDLIKNQVFHVGSGEPVSILEIATMIVDYLQVSRDLITFIGDRPGQVAMHICSTEKTKRLLGWEAEISFEEGLRSVIEWYALHQKRLEYMEMLMYNPIYTNENVLEMH